MLPSGRVCAVTFDFRGKDALADIKARCPVCGSECDVAARWTADDNGYHVSRDVIVRLANDCAQTIAKLEELRFELAAKRERGG